MAPINAGYSFPCKGFPKGPSITTITGNTVNIQLEGSATHGGGHCQFGITTDDSNFVVLSTVIRNCLITGMSYSFELPNNFPETDITVFWTWVNAIGNREYYMDCADVTVKNGNSNQQAVITGLDLLVLNLPGYTTIPEFPNPGMYDGSELFDSRQQKSITVSGSVNEQTSSQTTQSTSTTTSTELTTTSTTEIVDSITTQSITTTSVPETTSTQSITTPSVPEPTTNTTEILDSTTTQSITTTTVPESTSTQSITTTTVPESTSTQSSISTTTIAQPTSIQSSLKTKSKFISTKTITPTRTRTKTYIKTKETQVYQNKNKTLYKDDKLTIVKLNKTDCDNENV
jgi:hypothetical protein